MEQVLPFNINTDLLTDLDKTGQKVRCDSIRYGSALESRVCLHSTAQLEFLPPLHSQILDLEALPRADPEFDLPT